MAFARERNEVISNLQEAGLIEARQNAPTSFSLLPGFSCAASPTRSNWPSRLKSIWEICVLCLTIGESAVPQPIVALKLACDQSQHLDRLRNALWIAPHREDDFRLPVAVEVEQIERAGQCLVILGCDRHELALHG